MLMFVWITKKQKWISILSVHFLVIKKKIMFKVNYDDYENVFEWNQQNYDHHHSKWISSIDKSKKFFDWFFSKLHEPFVYNDLSPYFDTSPVERAIYSVNSIWNQTSIFFSFFHLNCSPMMHHRDITIVSLRWVLSNHGKLMEWIMVLVMNF